LVGSGDRKLDNFDAIKLKTYNWRADALVVDNIGCSLISDHFSEKQACFDSALIMRGIAHEWHYLGCGSPCEVDCSEATSGESKRPEPFVPAP